MLGLFNIVLYKLILVISYRKKIKTCFFYWQVICFYLFL